VSLDYDRGLVRLQVQTNFDTIINHQQAPFSGTVAGEQVIEIQSSLRLWIFSGFLLIFHLHLLFLIILKKNQSRVLLNPSFLLDLSLFIFANPNWRWTATPPTKNIYFVDGLEKFCRKMWRTTPDLKAKAKELWNLYEKLYLQDREEINLIATHPREIVPQDCRSNRHRQRGDQVWHRWREECIQVNHDSRYAAQFMLNTFYLFIASEGRNQGRMKQRRHKSCCIRQDQESTPTYEDQKDD
jgi:hypothetical protein